VKNMVEATMLFLTWENPFLFNSSSILNNLPKDLFFHSFCPWKKKENLKKDRTLYPWLKGEILTIIRSLIFPWIFFVKIIIKLLIVRVQF
jgi:hypothetical protein